MIQNYKKMVDGQLQCVWLKIVNKIYHKNGITVDKSKIKMVKQLKIYQLNREDKFQNNGFQKKEWKLNKIRVLQNNIVRL